MLSPSSTPSVETPLASGGLLFSDFQVTFAGNDLYLDTNEPGALLAFTGPVDQRFTLVPEAPALALCSLGALGLVLMGYRRRATPRLET